MNWDGLGLNEFDLFIEFDMPSATRIVWSHPARSFYSGPEACWPHRTSNIFSSTHHLRGSVTKRAAPQWAIARWYLHSYPHQEVWCLKRKSSCGTVHGEKNSSSTDHRLLLASSLLGSSNVSRSRFSVRKLERFTQGDLSMFSTLQRIVSKTFPIWSGDWPRMRVQLRESY